MKITVLQNYDWPVPNSRSWIAFKAGWSGRVTRAQGRDMVALGVAISAEPQESPRKDRSTSRPN